MNTLKKIYVVTHKKTKLPTNEKIYKLIAVGNFCKDKECDCIKDNTNENISEKNPNYCELTALYWIWKNDKKSDIVGISHYRRFFTKNIFNKIKEKCLNEKQIERLIKKYDIIIPEPMIIKKNNVIEQYSNSHYPKDLYICRDIIKEKYPEYVASFDKVMKRKYYSQFNMLICKKELYDDYMKWIFDVLFEAEKRIDISEYSDYNKRIFGFMSERLFNVWLDNNKKLKIKELPLYFSEEKVNKLKMFLGYIKYKLVCSIYKIEGKIA